MLKIKRIGAFLIDYYIILFISSFVSFLISFICAVLNLISKDNFFDFWFDLPMYISFIGLVFKDIILKNKSIGKNLLKIEVQDKNNHIITSTQLIIRNIFYIIWPIEALILFIFNQRLGDMIAKTKVVESNHILEKNLEKI